MKLANSWPTVAPATTPSGQLYDEYEELDEVDESKDGCGGVAWCQYVLKQPRSSNKVLHQLAREVRGLEKKRGRPLTVTQYRAICDKWEDASRPFLRKGHDYFPEFLAKLDSVTMLKGETLETAFQRAQHREPPSKVVLVRNNGLRLLASLCQELHDLYGDQPIMLCQTSVAKLFHVTQQTISTWIHALKTLEVLKLPEPAIKNARAARYHFIE